VERVRLLISDLDGTLLGDDRALGRFLQWYRPRKDRLRLAYSSGRFLEPVRLKIDEFGLPEPDGVICGVGTEIHDLRSGERLAGWPRDCDAWDPEIVRATCAKLAELVDQPAHLLSHYKVSYYGYDLSDAFLRRLEQLLTDAGQRVSIIYSSDRDLDVLPAGANKGTAAAYLVDHWGIAHEQVIVAGDTGNDAGMFRSGFRGIIVANALPELKRLHGPNIYHATTAFADGVVEGVQHWLQGHPATSPFTGGPTSWDPSAGRGKHE
jgi:sucrose-6F-phosphate phosphohydrolase